MTLNPYLWLRNHLENRYTKKELARQIILCLTLFTITCITVTLYFTSMALHGMEKSWSDDDRIVLINQSDHQEFSKHYSQYREEGWCLYGYENQTHIVIDRVIHSGTDRKQSHSIQFSCIPETSIRILEDWELGFLGIVHSHPQSLSTELSKGDMMFWGSNLPLISVQGIYVDGKNLAIYTVSSYSEPLDLKINRDG